MEIKEFQFEYMTFKIKLTIDALYITIKQGIRTLKVKISQLKYLYLIKQPIQGLISECIIRYETKSGKLKNLRLCSNMRKLEFKKAMDAITERRPDIDIRSMSEKDAKKLLKTAKTGKVPAVISASIVISSLIICFLPQFLHRFDSGQQTVNITECQGECNVSTHNIILTGGYLFTEDYVIDDNTDEMYIAYVPDNWLNKDPVFAIVKIPALSKTQIIELSSRKNISVVMRSILWEGINDEVRSVYNTDTGIQLAANARLYEYGADTEIEFLISVMIAGIGIVTLIIVAMIIRRTQKGIG